jgi:hypothetical protein
MKRTPFGYFDSTTLMGHHDDDDILHFKKGAVTWETCCGNSAVGTFSRSNGVWTWTFTTGRKRPTTNTFSLHPGVFSLICIDAARPTNVFRLTRRVFSPASFAGGDESESQPATRKALPQPKTQLLRDALAVIARTTNGPVALDQLPESVRALGPSRAVVMHDVLVLYTADKKGKILNPEGGRSVPAINMFMISADDEPGVFSFDAF